MRFQCDVKRRGDHDMTQTNGSQIFEEAIESDRDYANPVWDVAVRARLTSPSGDHKEIEAFWDGGRSWRLRFSPDEAGTWSYRTTCSDPANESLHKEGSFTAQAYHGDNPLYRHGPLRLSQDRRHLSHADGTPFFWLADTAWNGILKAKPEDWEQYLAARREQGFTAVQCVMTQWRAYEDEAAFTGEARIAIRPEFFRRLDEKVAAVSRQGLLPALVLLWALTPRDPGHYLPEEDCVRLARYLVARYGAYRAVWLLGGDGRYLSDNIERWKRIGRGVFGGMDEHVVTLHPAGMEWVGEAFREEPWYSLISYQSGHGDDHHTLRWLVEGPPAREWSNEPALPVINQEPCYEAHLAYQSRQPFDAHKVRRALYWSLLVSPTAGVTYGHHGVWPWMEERGVPLDHPNSGEASTWREALASEGAFSVSHLRALFSGLEWWKLCPAQDGLAEQPGEANPERFIALARADTRLQGTGAGTGTRLQGTGAGTGTRRQGTGAGTGESSFALAYTPAGDAIALREETFSAASWYDPRTGERREASSSGGRFTPPGPYDWVLLLH
jgi:hypothetical protein